LNIGGALTLLFLASRTVSSRCRLAMAKIVLNSVLQLVFSP
jgi:hypothetical protein